MSGVEIVEFDLRRGTVDGLRVVTPKQVTDDRGTIRELFRASAFASVGVELAPFAQINLTESKSGAIRGLHAEAMTKLVTVVTGEAFGAFVDLRAESPTFGSIDTVALVPGVQVLVPAGVANGFQTLSETSQYVYCFDEEWRPGMPGRAVNPLDETLAIDWPMPIDPGNPSQISEKDRTAPAFTDVRGEVST